MPDVTGTPLVVPSDLQGAGMALNKQAQGIVDQLDALKTQLAPLAETRVGPAASYYHPLQAEWNMAAEGLFGPTGALGQTAGALTLSWTNSSECEWSHLNDWQR